MVECFAWCHSDNIVRIVVGNIHSPFLVVNDIRISLKPSDSRCFYLNRPRMRFWITLAYSMHGPLIKVWIYYGVLPFCSTRPLSSLFFIILCNRFRKWKFQLSALRACAMAIYQWFNCLYQWPYQRLTVPDLVSSLLYAIVTFDRLHWITRVITVFATLHCKVRLVTSTATDILPEARHPLYFRSFATLHLH